MQRQDAYCRSTGANFLIAIDFSLLETVFHASGACNSSERRSLAEASANGCQTVVYPLQIVHAAAVRKTIERSEDVVLRIFCGFENAGIISAFRSISRSMADVAVLESTDPSTVLMRRETVEIAVSRFEQFLCFCQSRRKSVTPC